MISTNLRANTTAVLDESNRAGLTPHEAAYALCTGSSLPLFDGSMVKDDAIVMAIGLHEPDKRELDGGLLSRSSTYVESLDSCQREASDIILAMASGAVAGPEQLNTLADLVQGLKPMTREHPT